MAIVQQATIEDTEVYSSFVLRPLQRYGLNINDRINRRIAELATNRMERERKKDLWDITFENSFIRN